MKAIIHVITIVIVILFQAGVNAQTNISLNNVNDYQPLTNGKCIIWLETVDNTNPRELVCYDIATKKRTKTNFGRSLMYYQFNGHQVTWCIEENEDFEIYDIEKDAVTCIDSRTNWDYLLNEKYVIYNRAEEDTIRIFNIETREKTKLVTKQGYPKDIRKDQLLFRGTDYNLYVFNLASSALTQVTFNNNEQIGGKAYISDNAVIWTGINNDANLWLYDIETGNTKLIVSSSNIIDIYVEGNYIIYKVQAAKCKLMQYNVNTAVTTQVTPADEFINTKCFSEITISSPIIQTHTTYKASDLCGFYSMPVISGSIMVYAEQTSPLTSKIIVRDLKSNTNIKTYDVDYNTYYDVKDNIVVWNNFQADKTCIVDLNSTEIYAWPKTGSMEIYAWSPQGYLNNKLSENVKLKNIRGKSNNSLSINNLK